MTSSTSSPSYVYTAEDLDITHLSDNLIGYLESTYRDTFPDLKKISERDALIKYGQVSVVRRLKEIKRQLEET